MPPKKAGGNAKQEAGRAKKAENENKKAQEVQKQKDAKEAKDWEAGAKSNNKAEAAAAKAAEAAAKKAEKAALLAEEEASLPSKPKPKAGPKKKAPRPAGPDSLASSSKVPELGDDKPKFEEKEAPVEFGATGIDQMLEALEVVNAKSDKDALGAKAGLIEKHPERRFKAAFEAYLERELPILKEDHPGLRQNQMRDIIFKQFQKATENPFNQVTVAHNASKEERLDALKGTMSAREAKYRVE